MAKSKSGRVCVVAPSPYSADRSGFGARKFIAKSYTPQAAYEAKVATEAEIHWAYLGESGAHMGFRVQKVLLPNGENHPCCASWCPRD